MYGTSETQLSRKRAVGNNDVGSLGAQRCSPFIYFLVSVRRYF